MATQVIFEEVSHGFRFDNKMIERKHIKSTIGSVEYTQTEELEFKDPEAREVWSNYVEVNSKNYSIYCIIRYAVEWAKNMQYLMKRGEGITVTDVAEKAFSIFDVEDISASMYDCMVNILLQFWKYGEELRKWSSKVTYEEMGLSILLS